MTLRVWWCPACFGRIASTRPNDNPPLCGRNGRVIHPPGDHPARKMRPAEYDARRRPSAV